jgi:hypothetical protein
MIDEENLKIHPAADLFPPMGQQEFKALKDDIEANGQREEIVMYEDQILDGRHRYQACQELGMKPRTRDYEGDNPVTFVISVNAHRRHLSKGQLATIAAEMTDSKWGGDRSKAQKCALIHLQAAMKLGVSERLVDQAAALRNAVSQGRAVPELQEAVRGGKMGLGQAGKIAKLPPGQQTKILAQTNGTGAVHRGRAASAHEHFTRRVDEMASQAEALSVQIGKFAANTRCVGNLTPDQRKLLVDTWRSSAKRFAVAAERLEQVSRPSSGPVEAKKEEVFLD